MKNILFLFLLLSPGAYAQTFYVEPTEYQYELKISEKLRYDGFKIAKSKGEADFTVECFATGQYNAWKMKDMFKGYVKISDSKTGKELGRTREVGANAYNIKQAGNRIMATIIKKHLPELLKSAKDYELEAKASQ